jgi:hypothetical protein
MSSQGKLLSYGHKPLFVRLDNSKYQEVAAGRISLQAQPWKHLKCEVVYKQAHEGLAMSFELTLDPDFQATDYVLFSFVHPYTRQDIDLSMAEFEQKCSSKPEVYFHSEVLCHSLEGLPMHLYTVTWDDRDNTNLQAIVDI